ncbi:DUF1838 family protein [Novosphingobium sp. YJ-S2-02]|uniref:DUF1838 family protein n=1 Tax=Novosphingobium aureum TaxID=2792964 RepID=A0A931HDC8_9SPHN|nr:DUF1838 family protein [Novosphingobium aureum]MBH0113339.1 DUF1838 family protein [Novosphingobium aureum]
MDDMTFSRRQSLGLAGAGIAAGLVTGTASASAATSGPSAKTPAFKTRIDFKDPEWNRDTYVRIDADIDPTKEKVGWLKGKVYGVRPNEPVRQLFLNEGFSVVRSVRQEDGSYRRLLREIVFYRDIETGKLIDKWYNPYTDETVDVVPIANDPFNFTISQWAPEPPSYGGLNKDKPPRKPFLMEWEEGPNDTLILRSDIDMMYPNGLDPKTWVRESSGPFNRVSEHFIYTMNRKDVENPKVTHIQHIGAWTRITPWLPWMLMGQAEGHVNYFNNFTTVENGISDLPEDLVAAARNMGDKWLHAPESDYGPSLSSIENYKKDHEPAPVPEGWEPARAPATPQPLQRGGK